MADAIPVHASPKVKPARTDANGVPQPDDYVLTVRENLGDPASFHGEGVVREMTSHLDTPEGKYVHKYTRKDC